MAANPVTSPTSEWFRLNQIRELIDDMIADKQAEEIEANLYSARLHVMRAIREVTA
jgi:hypothetical protein